MILVKEKSASIDLVKILRHAEGDLHVLEDLLRNVLTLREGYKPTHTTLREGYEKYRARLEEQYKEVETAHQAILAYFRQSKTDQRDLAQSKDWINRWGNRLIGVLELILIYDKKDLMKSDSYFELISHFAWEINYVKADMHELLPNFSFGFEFEKSLDSLNEFFGTGIGRG